MREGGRLFMPHAPSPGEDRMRSLGFELTATEQVARRCSPGALRPAPVPITGMNSPPAERGQLAAYGRRAASLTSEYSRRGSPCPNGRPGVLRAASWRMPGRSVLKLEAARIGIPLNVGVTKDEQ
jgi:hypothetical protein